MAHAASAFSTLPALAVFKDYRKKRNALNFTFGSEKYYRNGHGFLCYDTFYYYKINYMLNVYFNALFLVKKFFAVIAGSEGRLNILIDSKLERKIWTSLT